MMKVPPLSLVGMERLPLPLPFSPELLWRYNPLGPPHSGPPASPSAAAAAAVAISRVNAVASLPNPLASQLPFAYDIKHTIPISLASDPRLWNREDVLTFLQWCEREFDLPSFDTDRFQMNGKALCLLTKSDLESRAPCSGDVIHNALQLLMSSTSESPLTPHTPSSMRLGPLSKGGWSIADLHYAASHQNGTTSVTLSPAPSLDGQAGSPQEHAGTNGNNHLSSSSSTGSAGNHSDDSEYDSVGESPQRSPVNQSLSPPPHSQSQQQHNSHQSNSSSSTTSSNGHNSSSNNNNNNNNNNHSSSQQIATSKSFSHGAKLSNGSGAEAGEYNNNGRLLWDFLQQLLNDPAQRYSSFIAWKNVETGIFKIVDPPGLARLWGIQKNHLSMNYDKMSRALRYYYRVNILRKVQGERHCYQFLRNPGELKSIKNISMLRHQQTSPVSLTVKSESSSFVDNEYDGLALIRHQQNSPVSLTVKSESSNFVDNDYDALSLVRHQQNSPVSLTVKSEPSYGDNAQDEYDDVPTDLSMDSERHLKDDD